MGSSKTGATSGWRLEPVAARSIASGLTREAPGAGWLLSLSESESEFEGVRSCRWAVFLSYFSNQGDLL